MGLTDRDNEEINRIEKERIREKLLPEEQHQWGRIRENLPTELVISYRAAVNEACSYVIGYEKVLLAEDRNRMVELGCDVVREKILKNPVFNETKIA